MYMVQFHTFLINSLAISTCISLISHTQLYLLQSLKIQSSQSQSLTHMEIEQHKQYSQLDEFHILKNLGSGLQATVKLGENKDGVKVAIKKYRTQRAKLPALEKEIEIIKHFSHQNIIRLIDCRPEATYTKKNGTQYKCTVVIFEYAGGGELFDYIADSGRFSEKVTRSYFGQLMNGLHHMHSKGFVHRDLKPQNLLLSQDFMLKIADFGFSCHKMKHNGVLETKLGTHGYMAPEIYQNKYNGEKADVFAAGVILFVMLVGGSPFNKATAQNTYYSFIINKKYDKFWKEFQRRRGANFFNPKFKDLIEKMLAFNPAERLSIVEIANHPWIQGEIPTFLELKADFEERKKKVDAAINKRKLEEEKKEKDAKENMKMEQGNIRGSQTGDVDSFVDELRAEQHMDRKVPVIQDLDTDDWVIAQKISYIIVRLKQFLKTLQLNPHCDPLQPHNLSTSQLLHLQKLQDSQKDEILAQFQFEDTIGDGQFVDEKVVLRFCLGTDGKGNAVLRCVEEDGDWFLARRVIGEVRKLFAHKIVNK